VFLSTPVVFFSFVQRRPREEASSTKETNIVPFYMSQFAYTAEAIAAMAKNPQDRSIPVRELAQKLGGRLIGFYFCFGEYDGVALSEAPDDTTATAIVMAAVSVGHIKAVKTTKLFTVEETMEAMRKAGSLTFQGPSKG
jgi:uncharacterized protein with GYD domain